MVRMIQRLIATKHRTIARLNDFPNNSKSKKIFHVLFLCVYSTENKSNCLSKHCLNFDLRLLVSNTCRLMYTKNDCMFLFLP